MHIQVPPWFSVSQPSLARVPRQNGTQRRQVDDGCSAEGVVFGAHTRMENGGCLFGWWFPVDFPANPMIKVPHFQILDQSQTWAFTDDLGDFSVRRFTDCTRRGKGRQVVPPGRQAHFAQGIPMYTIYNNRYGNRDTSNRDDTRVFAPTW